MVFHRTPTGFPQSFPHFEAMGCRMGVRGVSFQNIFFSLFSFLLYSIRLHTRAFLLCLHVLRHVGGPACAGGAAVGFHPLLIAFPVGVHAGGQQRPEARQCGAVKLRHDAVFSVVQNGQQQLLHLVVGQSFQHRLHVEIYQDAGAFDLCHEQILLCFGQRPLSMEGSYRNVAPNRATKEKNVPQKRGTFFVRRRRKQKQTSVGRLLHVVVNRSYSASGSERTSCEPRCSCASNPWQQPCRWP